MNYDVVAQNHIQEICQWTQDVRFLPGKVNSMADQLSRPPHVPIGTAYQLEPLDAFGPGPHVAETGPLRAETAESHLLSSQSVALNIVDHRALAHAQKTCQDVSNHRAGKHPPGLNMEDYEFSPGVTLYCDVSNGRKARPLVPATWRDTILQMFHGIHHPGLKTTLHKVADRYYWPTMRADIAEFVKW